MTGEWIYEPGNGVLLDKIQQRSYNLERKIPLKFRTLADVLNPQKAASTVVRELLAWTAGSNFFETNCRSYVGADLFFLSSGLTV